MRVEVYWNLHKDCWSVRALEGKDKGRVVEHTNSLYLEEPQFIVQKAGRDQVRRTGQKAIHAFVRGHWLPKDSIIPLTGAIEPFTYNPYRDDTFITRGQHSRPIHSGDIAILSAKDKKPVTYVVNANV